jgi:hypothetical protein
MTEPVERDTEEQEDPPQPSEDPALHHLYDIMKTGDQARDDLRRRPRHERGQDRRRDAPQERRGPGGLAPDDPYWTFGAPPETWGRTLRDRGRGRQQGGRQQGGRQQGWGHHGGGPHDRPRRSQFFECQRCGVKVERKAAHGQGRVPCPFCSRPMVLK